jgi:hypothetical protein
LDPISNIIPIVALPLWYLLSTGTSSTNRRYSSLSVALLPDYGTRIHLHTSSTRASQCLNISLSS